MKKKPRLTQRELDVMGVLWQLGEATVTEVRERIDPDLAYTSVSSMVRMLELKGYLWHRKGEGKTHVYYPLVKAEEAGASVLTRMLDRIYGGSPFKLLAHLVEQREFSAEELSRMRALLKNAPEGRASSRGRGTEATARATPRPPAAKRPRRS